MKKVHERLYVGSELNCRSGNDAMAVVHACKSPCHQRAVGYRGSLPSSHPNYLVLEKGFDLYLNIIDPDKPLFMPLLFTSFLEFSMFQWNAGREILVHCNQGESRAPTLAMMFMAKRLHSISNKSFEKARQDFQNIYPYYSPGIGIQIYLGKNWNTF
ncbi:MAG: dual specificity protein phosphatase family protein [Deltaproteobacteria bacterium]|nr:dual specificity protein phosphatase family protein [Deltaproteobacteria bacterium]